MVVGLFSIPLMLNIKLQRRWRRRRQIVGRIALVGAGPGDPDLLTVKAVKEIESAEVIVSDYLVPEGILSLVGKHQKLLIARKRKCGQHRGQELLNEWCKEALADGKRVVRLKGGDPYVFGRGFEEVQYFRKLGYEPVVVPGLSSSLSAPLLGGVSVTSRDSGAHANQILISTGHGMNGDSPSVPPFNARRTLVFLMAVKRMESIMQNLIHAGGYPPDLPVAVIERASTPQQRITFGTASSIAEIASKRNVSAPAVIVAGCRAAERFNVLATSAVALEKY